MHDRIRLVLLILLLLSPVELRRSGGRGGSQSRAQVPSGQPHPQSNFGQPHPQSNFGQPHPQSNFGQPHPQPNFNRGPVNNFHPAPMAPKTSSHTFGKALLGGAAGALGAIVVYEGAKAIIKSATTPFNYGGRDYYWDQNNRVNSNQQQCSKLLSELQHEYTNEEKASTTTVSPSNATDMLTTTAASTTPSLSQTLGNLQYQNGSRPKTITWSCLRNQEVCCGLDCCANPNYQANPNQSSNAASHGSGLATILLIVLLVILIGGCCCCIIAFMACRSAFDCIFPRQEKQYEEGYQQNVEYSNPQQQQYPMHQYPQQQPFQAAHYPNQYHPQQNYPNNYPAQPTY